MKDLPAPSAKHGPGTSSSFAVPSAPICAACGEPIPIAGPDGGCPGCMFAIGLETPGEAVGNDDPAAVPPRFGHFEIAFHADGNLHELGRGAMGLSYLARDTSLDCLVALKVIDARLSARPDARARFLREARAAARLRHPNVASIFHYGEENGQCFYAMEFVEGETLETRVRRDGPLPPALALDIATQVARALVAADARGVVHRDLKPANLMLATGDGHGAGAAEPPVVKVIDFGLAKAAAATDGGDDGRAADLTRGGFVGTPAFASPEQFAAPPGEGGAADVSRRIDTRSDIYSLGVTLWYLLTGKVPFVGRDLAEIHERQMHRPLPLEHLAAARVPAPVVKLLSGMLAADPSDRPQTPRELAGQLRHCQEQIGLPRAGAPGPRRRMLLAGGVATLFVASMAAALVFASHHPFASAPPAPARPPTPGREPDSDEKSVAVLPFENLSSDKDNAFLADGIQDDVITSLAKIRGLKVISRASVMGFRGTTGTDKLREISRALDVRSLVEGTVRHAEDRIIITVHLLDPRTGRQLWGETYDRTLRDALSLQGEVARAVADALRVTLSPEEKARLERPPTTNSDAYALYLRGEAFYRTHVFNDARQAQTLFEQAARLDPEFALAWAKVSLTRTTQYAQRTTPISPAEFAAAARVPAETALRLQPDLAEAHLALASYLGAIGNFGQALAENELAARLAPNDGNVLGSLALSYGGLGREAEARVIRERAATLNPQDGFRWRSLGISCETLRDWPAAARAYDRMIQVQPESSYACFLRVWLEIAWKGDLEPARAFYRDLPANAEVNVWILNGRYQLALFRRDYAGAEEVCDRAVQVVSVINMGVVRYLTFYRGKTRLARNAAGDAACAREDFEKAFPGYQAMVDADPKDGYALAELGEVLACLGREKEARAAAVRALTLNAGEDAQGKPVSIEAARIYARLDDRDLAVPLIERLLSAPSGLNIQEIRFSPDWDPIRADARVQALLRRGGVDLPPAPP